jgi:hypothetical protein
MSQYTLRNSDASSHRRSTGDGYGGDGDGDVLSTEATKVLGLGSAHATASSGGMEPPGAVVATWMPMLKVSNFDGGRTPEARSYAILVLVLQ